MPPVSATCVVPEDNDDSVALKCSYGKTRIARRETHIFRAPQGANRVSHTLRRCILDFGNHSGSQRGIHRSRWQEEEW